jgi:RimJ/RimL family protein N-acetyltransferase
MTMKERIWPADIENGEIRVRLANPETDAPALYAPSHGDDCDAQIWRWMHWGPFPDVDAFQAWMQVAVDHPMNIALTVDILKGDAWVPVGQLRTMEISEGDRRCEIGTIWYIPDVQGEGISRRMTGMMLRHIFDNLQFRRVEWKCHHRNVRSAAAAKSYGFTYEGTFRQHMVVKGQSRDTVWFSMLDTEWPAIKSRLYTT